MDCYWITNTVADITKLCKASKGVAVLPMGCLESHGPHLPLGCDSLCVSHAVSLAVARETVAVLPTLNYGYVVEAQTLPGAVHMPSQTLMDQLEAICDDVWRNGFDKIILAHGHGGNGSHTTVFSQRMVEKGKQYAVYNVGCFGGDLGAVRKVIESELWGHACEAETSLMLSAAPHLVHLDRLKGRRFPAHPSPDTGLAQSPAWWIAAHPEMAVGDPLKATKEKGEKLFGAWANALVETIRKIKKDKITVPALRRHAANRDLRGRKRK